MEPGEKPAVTRIGIAVVEHDQRVLIGTRQEPSPLAGLAEFPGGKCLPGETSAECAQRECLEETGLEVQAVRLLDHRTHTYPHGTVELSFWLCQAISPELISPNHHGFRWIDRQDLGLINFPEANRTVIAMLVNQGKMEDGQ